MEKYQNKYRIASTRAAWWNYGWNGAYFITICTRNREHIFGEIRNGEIILSNLGVIANVLWHEIPMHAPNVDLGDFIVMPNHIHGIVILNKPESKQLNNSLGFDSLKNKENSINAETGIVNAETGIINAETGIINAETGIINAETGIINAETGIVNTETGIINAETGIINAETGIINAETGHALSLPGDNRFQNIGKNTISSIIGSYKSAVTKHANRLGIENGWQTRFHDHIIRNDNEYQKISDYIVNNPNLWNEDRYF
jgi:REP element-mobilizing transposase RayT